MDSSRSAAWLRRGNSWLLDHHFRRMLALATCWLSLRRVRKGRSSSMRGGMSPSLTRLISHHHQPFVPTWMHIKKHSNLPSSVFFVRTGWRVYPRLGICTVLALTAQTAPAGVPILLRDLPVRRCCVTFPSGETSSTSSSASPSTGSGGGVRLRMNLSIVCSAGCFSLA